MKHKHRIKPGYAGGEYKESNIVLLSPVQHAMWHFAEWQRKGNLEDKLAWKGLAGFSLESEEKLRLASQIGGKIGGKRCHEIYPNQASEMGKVGGPASIASFKSKGTTPAQKVWVLTSPSGEEIKVTNLSKFCRENSLSVSHLSEVASGHRKHSKGWKARRLE